MAQPGIKRLHHNGLWSAQELRRQILRRR